MLGCHGQYSQPPWGTKRSTVVDKRSRLLCTRDARLSWDRKPRLPWQEMLGRHGQESHPSSDAELDCLGGNAPRRRRPAEGTKSSTLDDTRRGKEQATRGWEPSARQEWHIGRKTTGRQSLSCRAANLPTGKSRLQGKLQARRKVSTTVRPEKARTECAADLVIPGGEQAYRSVSAVGAPLANAGESRLWGAWALHGGAWPRLAIAPRGVCAPNASLHRLSLPRGK